MLEKVEMAILEELETCGGGTSKLIFKLRGQGKASDWEASVVSCTDPLMTPSPSSLLSAHAPLALGPLVLRAFVTPHSPTSTPCKALPASQSVPPPYQGATLNVRDMEHSRSGTDDHGRTYVDVESCRGTNASVRRVLFTEKASNRTPFLLPLCE